jgi:hypothetical protein
MLVALAAVVVLPRISGCAASEETMLPEEVVAEDVSQRAGTKVLHELERHNLVLESVDGRPEEYYARNLLPRLSPRLAVGRLLRLQERDGFANGVLGLRRLSKDDVAHLAALTLPEVPPTGFLIVHEHFWRDVRRLQHDGINFVFFEPEQERPLAGFYSHSESLIGINVFANVGTLVHELRHREQWRRVRKAERSRGGDSLSAECIQSASTYFGELDATTEQLRYWRGVSDWIVESANTSGENGEAVFAQAQILLMNLDYPVFQGSEFLDENHCPAELNEVVRDILAHRGHERALAGSVDGLRRLAIAGTRVRSYLARDQCGYEDRVLPDCDEHAEYLAAIEKKTADIKERLDAQLDSAIASRRPEIHERLQKLSPPVRSQLCREALGFAFLASCAGE